MPVKIHLRQIMFFALSIRCRAAGDFKSHSTMLKDMQSLPDFQTSAASGGLSVGQNRRISAAGEPS